MERKEMSHVLISTNESIRSATTRVNWHAKLPENVFTEAPDAVFFLDSDVAFTAGLLEHLVQVNEAMYSNDVLISVGSRIQSCAEPGQPTAVYRLASGTGAPIIESISNVRGALLEGNVDLMDTVKIVTNESADWIIYDYGLEAISVLSVFYSPVSRVVSRIEWERLSDFYFTIDDIVQGEKGDGPKGRLFSLFEPQFLHALVSNYRRQSTDGERT